MDIQISSILFKPVNRINIPFFLQNSKTDRDSNGIHKTAILTVLSHVVEKSKKRSHLLHACYRLN